MATQLSSLKITNVTRQIKTDTVEFRRTKLIKKIEEQIALATAQKNGELFTVKRLKNVKDEASGTTSQIEVSKRINAWYWTDNNKTYLQIKYGTKVLCLQGKDKNTIETASHDDLVKTLFLVRTIVTSGELDTLIEAASVKVRERFGK